MIVQRTETETGPMFKLIKDGIVFTILFGGNGDLYWSIDNLNKENMIRYQDFLITKENYFIYDVFNELYERVTSAELFDVDSTELSFAESSEEVQAIYDKISTLNANLKRSREYKEIYDGSKIMWTSDNRDLENESYINITKKDEVFLVEFFKVRQEDIYSAGYLIDNNFGISIRFRNSGSTYTPFNLAFMKFYRSLCAYFPEYHQIHLAEIAYNNEGRK